MTTTLPGLRLPGYSDGIDISKYQGILDADAVRAAGFTFAFVKTSEGLGYCDPKALAHLHALRDAGLYTGGYGFARVEQGDPRAQARKAVDGCGGSEHMVRPVLDLESAPKTWGAAALSDFAEEWLDEARKSGALPVLYSYTSFLARMGADANKTRLWRLLFDAPLWLAQYASTGRAWAPTSEADVPRGYNWQLWQYSGDKGYRVPGIDGDCDRNLFRGSEAELRDWFGLPPEGTTIDMGGPVHGTDIVDGAIADRKLGPFS